MPRITQYLRIEAEDPFAPQFESIAALTERIKRSLESEFGEVALKGEVSNVARPRSGHVYLTLKDELASIRAVMWKTDAQRVAFDLTDGLLVRVLGRVTVYPARGEYQVVIKQIEPEGLGALELAFRQRYARLAAEGLFEPGRKRPLPRFPRRIVVVTSPSGAAVRDVLQIINRRWRRTEILIAATRVQGEGADREVVAALALANQIAAADVIIVTRGGGSLEDLWTFNEESVVRAIVGSRLPVISAVGHEIDVTLADLAADRRALTPSEAGEFSVPDAREIGRHVDQLADRLRLAGLSRLRDARARLDLLGQRARQAITHDLFARRRRADQFAAALEALSPLGVLSRGYSLTFRADGKTLIRSALEIKPGETITTRLATSEIKSRVEAVSQRAPDVA
jgi:exodeoxyribonuclease VII large subunit